MKTFSLIKKLNCHVFCGKVSSNDIIHAYETIKPYFSNLIFCPQLFHFLERVPYQSLWPEAPIYYKEKTLARRCYIDEVGGCYIEKTFPSLPRHLAEERGNCSTRPREGCSTSSQT